MNRNGRIAALALAWIVASGSAPAEQPAAPAISTLRDFVADHGGRLALNQRDVLIEAHGECRWLDNNSDTSEFFVPIASAPEWQSFVAYAPATITRATCCPIREATLTASSGDMATFSLPVGREGANDERGRQTLSQLFSFTLHDGSSVVETISEEYICQSGAWAAQGPVVVAKPPPIPPPVVPSDSAGTPEYIFSSDCRQKRAWDTPYSLQDTFFKWKRPAPYQWFSSYPGDATDLYCMGSRQRNDAAKMVFDLSGKLPANAYRVVIDSLIGEDGRPLQLDIDLLSGTEAGGGMRSGGGKKHSTKFYVASYDPLTIVNEGHHNGSDCKPCSGIAPTWLKIRTYVAGPDGLPAQCGSAVHTRQHAHSNGPTGALCAFGGTPSELNDTLRSQYGLNGAYTWSCTATNGSVAHCSAPIFFPPSRSEEHPGK